MNYYLLTWLILRLDAIKAGLLILMAVIVISILFEKATEEDFDVKRKPLTKKIALAIFLIVALVVVPTTKQAIVIYSAPKVLEQGGEFTSGLDANTSKRIGNIINQTIKHLEKAIKDE